MTKPFEVCSDVDWNLATFAHPSDVAQAMRFLNVQPDGATVKLPITIDNRIGKQKQAHLYAERMNLRIATRRQGMEFLLIRRMGAGRG